MATLAVLKVSGIGCASCVAPAKEHFLKVPGVEAVHVLGNRVYLVLGDGVDLRYVLEKSGVEDFYTVRVESVEALSMEEALEKIRGGKLKLVI